MFVLIIPVVLAGGTGSRLWPLSNELFPKQYLNLGENHLSMLQETLNRVKGFTNIQHAIVVTSVAHESIVSMQLSEIGFYGAQVILEPEGKNTAPAIALAAFKVMEQFPEATLLVLPSDHIISDLTVFERAVLSASKSAQQGSLVTFGVKPSYPETGYGYIKSASLGEVAPVEQFVEKPDRYTAEQYVANGNYFWNSGMFLFQAKTYLNELQQLQPEMYSACKQAINLAQQNGQVDTADSRSLSMSPNLSIDYAVMEKTSRAVMIPFNSEWIDIGSWKALCDYKLSLQNVNPGNAYMGDGNLFEGEVFSLSSKNNYVHSDDTIVSLVGVDNLIVIKSDNGILITTKDSAQQVGQMVSIMKSKKDSG